MQMQTADGQKKENFFDENGNTIQAGEMAADESVDEGVDDVDGEAEVSAEAEAPAAKKYKIGDREFDTAEEALAFAESQVTTLETETQVVDAYRQGMKDALSQTGNVAENVTPQAEVQSEFNTEELYTDPQSFLKKFAQKVKTETRAEIDHRDSLKETSDKIWREFTDRHPSLADFREEVEDFVLKNTPKVQAIIGTKGRPASYDWIATNLMSRFESYARTLKPQRALPNSSAGSSPAAKAGGVTQKQSTKKPLSFAEQIRTIRKRR